MPYRTDSYEYFLFVFACALQTQMELTCSSSSSEHRYTHEMKPPSVSLQIKVHGYYPWSGNTMSWSLGQTLNDILAATVIPSYVVNIANNSLASVSLPMTQLWTNVYFALLVNTFLNSLYHSEFWRIYFYLSIKVNYLWHSVPYSAPCTAQCTIQCSLHHTVHPAPHSTPYSAFCTAQCTTQCTFHRTVHPNTVICSPSPHSAYESRSAVSVMIS